MSYIFPRVVWFEIYKNLTFQERSHLRVTCKFLAKFSNNEKLKYWLERDDPITLHLKKNITEKKIYSGVYIEKIQFCMIFISIYKDAHEQVVIENYDTISRIIRPRPYSAWKHGRFNVLNHMLKNPNLLHVKSYVKYLLATKQHLPTHLIKEITSLKLHYLSLRFNGPSEFIEMYENVEINPEIIKLNHFKVLIKKNDLNAFNLINVHPLNASNGFTMACKKNNAIMAEEFLKYLNGAVNGFDCSRIFNLKNNEILRKFLQFRKKNFIVEILKTKLLFGEFHHVKRLVSIAYLF